MRTNSANLDLLRALAVITVMIDHLLPTLVHHGVHPPIGLQKFCEHIGHAGVLAFFVHTSLVLMYSLERMEPHAPDRGALTLRFYVRRFFRIYPLAVACVVAVLVLGLPDATWHDPITPTTQEIVANLLLVQNLWTGHSVLVPLWSLPYEVEMYVVLPALYFIARRRNGVQWIGALLIASYLGAYVFRKLEHGHMNMAAYAPCFIAGVLCYTLGGMRARLPGTLWPLFVIALMAGYCWIHMISWRVIYWLGWSYSLVLALAINLFDDGPWRWLNAAAQRVATYSYGLYLLHVPALYVVFGLWKPESIVLAIVAYVALAAAGAVAAFHLIEQPFIELGRRLSDGAALRRRPAA